MNTRILLSSVASLCLFALAAPAQQPPPKPVPQPAEKPANAETPSPAKKDGEQKPVAPAPRTSHKYYNLDKQKLALQGYDPVAYFPEGGGKPKAGKKAHQLQHRGVVYRFSSKANLERFQKTPDRYEPAYGGWCAYAMRDGNKVEVDAESFLIQDGRLMLFYNGFFNNTRKSWSKGDTKAQEQKADTNWKKISGESAPKPAPAKNDRPK